MFTTHRPRPNRSHDLLRPDSGEPRPPGGGRVGWRGLAAVEMLLAGVAIVFDLWILTLVLLALAGLSLAVRRRGPGSLGLVRPSGGRWWPLQLLGYAAGWTVLTIGLTIPVLEHLAGERRDVSQFAVVQGNLGTLALLLAVSWTLAAVGEEVAYRGFLLTRLRQVLGGEHAGLAATVAASVLAAVAFGWAHAEQGVVGVASTCIDALFFTWLRFRYRSVWASVLAHGFLNTIGLVTYFFVGPVYGLW